MSETLVFEGDNIRLEGTVGGEMDGYMILGYLTFLDSATNEEKGMLSALMIKSLEFIALYGDDVYDKESKR